MAKTKFDIKTATKPLYAGVGVADLAVEAVRDYAVEVQKRVTDVQKDVKKMDLSAKGLRAQAESRVTGATKDAQGYLNENLSAVTDTYGQLITRGEGLVQRIRNQQSTKTAGAQARTTASKAKATRTSTDKAARSTTTAAKQSAKTATRSTAKKSAAKRTTAKSNAKATTTSAKKTAASTAKAVSDAAEKIGD